MKPNKRYLKKKKTNYKLITFITLIIFISICYFVIGLLKSNGNNNYEEAISINPNYTGIGQELADNKDGYYTTFTTVEKNKKTYIEYKQNGSSSWANNPYWGGTVSDSGCSITAVSIITSGYGSKHTPEDFRKRYYPKLDNDSIGKILKSDYNIDNTDFLYNQSYFTSEYIINWLESNRPVLVCIWTNNGSNRWTTTSHYICLLATDGLNNIYVSNPSRSKRF